jgi:hypothetical protein
MKFAAKKNPTVLAGFFFRAKFHSNSLYVVKKKIVGISQYPYFNDHMIRPIEEDLLEESTPLEGVNIAD